VTMHEGFVLLRGKRDSVPYTLFLERNIVTLGMLHIESMTYVTIAMLHISFWLKKRNITKRV